MKSIYESGRRTIIQKFYEAYEEQIWDQVDYLQEAVWFFQEIDSQQNWTLL